MALLAFVGQNAAAADFDGDGNDDLLLRHLHSDAWRYYTFVDDVPVERDLGLESEPVWRFVATGDFDGDGRGDVLLRMHDTLESAYHAVTTSGIEVRPVNLTTDPLHDVLGVGDLDGDGGDEILVRNTDDGGWFYYDVDGPDAVPRHDFGATRNLAYAFAAIGDLDGDGRDDKRDRPGRAGAPPHHAQPPVRVAAPRRLQRRRSRGSAPAACAHRRVDPIRDGSRLGTAGLHAAAPRDRHAARCIVDVRRDWRGIKPGIEDAGHRALQLPPLWMPN